jgi:hypothetical protein
VQRRPALVARVSTRRYSVGVRRTGDPSLVTSLASRSMVTSPAVTTRGRSVPVALAWRRATRILAISSATPNGLVT